MAINQSQNGVDDEIEVPQELFANDRFKLVKKGNGRSLKKAFLKLF